MLTSSFFRALWDRVFYVIFIGDTASVRFFFALCSFGMGLDMLSIDGSINDYKVALYQLAPQNVPWLPGRYFWGFGFLWYSWALLWGLAGRYNFLSLALEPLIGWMLWVAVASLDVALEQHMTASVGAAVVATWLLVRYPTHSKASRG